MITLGSAQANCPGPPGRALEQAAAAAASRSGSALQRFSSGPVQAASATRPPGLQHPPRLAQRGLRVGDQHVAPAAQDAVQRGGRAVDRDVQRRSAGSGRWSRPSSSARRCAAASISGAKSRRDQRPAGLDQLGGQEARVARCRPRGPAPSCPACGLIASTIHVETGIVAPAPVGAARSHALRRRAPAVAALLAVDRRAQRQLDQLAAQQLARAVRGSARPPRTPSGP